MGGQEGREGEGGRRRMAEQARRLRSALTWCLPLQMPREGRKEGC